MNILKTSYKTVREHDDEIFKAFGFRHLSDATQYYVHPGNQSRDLTTNLSQSIGEALVLFSSILSKFLDPKSADLSSDSEQTLHTDLLANDANTSFYLRVQIPEDWKENGVVSEQIQYYEAMLERNEITVSACDQDGKHLDGDPDNLNEWYKLLPAIAVMMLLEFRTNTDFSNRLLKFIANPAADAFVSLHEDFYQAHKFDEYELLYEDLSQLSTEGMNSIREQFRIIAQNLREIEVSRTQRKAIKKMDGMFLSAYAPYIPQLPPEIVIPDEVRGVCNAVIDGDIRALLFHGPAGTGKTMSCKLLCQEIGMPLMDVINCTENLDEFILGKYIPEEDRIVFRESFVTKAIRDGGAVVFEEINFAKPQYLAFLNSLLDDNGFVRLDNGEVVQRHENFRFFATMNIGYYGTKELNQALYNRFNAVLELDALSDAAIRRMLLARVPECAPVVDKLLSVYHKIKKMIESQELDMVISPRNLENWARLAKHEGYLLACDKTVVPIARGNKAMEESIRGIVRVYRWNE